MNIHEIEKPQRLSVSITGIIISTLSFLASGEVITLLIIPPLTWMGLHAYHFGSTSLKDLEVDLFLGYNFNNYHQLVSIYENIRSYEDVKIWDESAEIEIISMNKYLSEKYAYRKSVQELYLRLKSNDKSKSFIENLFSYKSKYRMIHKIIHRIDSLELDSYQSELRQKVEFTPNNDTEKREILNQLDLLKANFKDQKSEFTHNMKVVKAHSQMRNSQINNSYFSSPSSRRLDREANKRNREAALNELQKGRYEVECKIADIERKIRWIQNIKDRSKVAS